MSMNYYRNKAEMKEHKKTTLLQNNGRKVREEGYLTPATLFSVFFHNNLLSSTDAK